MAVKVIRKKGNISLKRLSGLYDELAKRNVTIGVHKEEGQAINSESGTKVIDYACYNEFGTHHITQHQYTFESHGERVSIPAGKDISIPARPFVRISHLPELRTAIKKRQGELFRELIAKKFKGGNISNANYLYKEIGKIYQEKMLDRITKGFVGEAPNKPLTLFLKGDKEHTLDYIKMPHKNRKTGEIYMKNETVAIPTGKSIMPLVDTGKLQWAIRYKVNQS